MVAENSSKTPGADSAQKAKLLEAAGCVFAEKGYRGATVREISRKAGMNIAAVSYYFGNKEKLYEAVLSNVFRYGEAHFEQAYAASDDVSAEERLRRFVSAFLAAGLDPKRPEWHRRIYAREINEPSAALKRLVNQTFRRRFETLRDIVATLLGPEADDALVVRCAFSVLGQCLFYVRGRRMLKAIVPDFRIDEKPIDVLTDHIVRFSLGGLRSLRRTRR